MGFATMTTFFTITNFILSLFLLASPIHAQQPVSYPAEIYSELSAIFPTPTALAQLDPNAAPADGDPLVFFGGDSAVYATYLAGITSIVNAHQSFFGGLATAMPAQAQLPDGFGLAGVVQRMGVGAAAAIRTPAVPDTEVTPTPEVDAGSVTSAVDSIVSTAIPTAAAGSSAVTFSSSSGSSSSSSSTSSDLTIITGTRIPSATPSTTLTTTASSETATADAPPTASTTGGDQGNSAPASMRASRVGWSSMLLAGILAGVAVL